MQSYRLNWICMIQKRPDEDNKGWFMGFLGKITTLCRRNTIYSKETPLCK